MTNHTTPPAADDAAGPHPMPSRLDLEQRHEIGWAAGGDGRWLTLTVFFAVLAFGLVLVLVGLAAAAVVVVVSGVVGTAVTAAIQLSRRRL